MGLMQGLDMRLLPDKDEQLQEQMQTLQWQLAKHKSQAARAQAKADHFKRLYKYAISMAR